MIARTCSGGRRLIVLAALAAAQAEAGGVNYIVCDMVFGNIGFNEATRSIELFAEEVMPAFADA